MWKRTLGIWPPYTTAGKILGTAVEKVLETLSLTGSAWHAQASHRRLGSDRAQSLPPSPPDPTKFQGDNAALSPVWSSLCLRPAKPVTTGSRERSLRAAFVGRPMSVESADLPPPLRRSAGELEHAEGSQMPFSNWVSKVLQGNDEWLHGLTPIRNWYILPAFFVSNSFGKNKPFICKTFRY